MADDRTNAMQANLGLGLPAPAEPQRTLTPAEVSIQLLEQASSRRAESDKILASLPRNLPSIGSFSAQYAQQLGNIQSQQSYNIYAAQALSNFVPTPGALSPLNYQAGMLPSPLSMTPPETGAYRPPTGTIYQGGIPPMTLPPLPVSPLVPRMPAPMFQSPRDQALRMQDVRADEMFSLTSQIPGVFGGAAAVAGGAAIGSRIGGMFGGAGRLIGAGAGAFMTGISGVAGGVSDLFQLPMQPAIQQREMGAAIQRMSTDWVIQGPARHQIGVGLSRDASIDLAKGIQGMAEDSRFQKDTGGMFNTPDLMKILSGAGKSGLMDMAQSIPQIQSALQQTAITISRFMELTNDPSVTNAIRRISQFRQMGMDLGESVQAAQGMKTYARQAGTTIEGVSQMGGLPGMMTFQQAGLSPATGFNYGNYAFASARQLVATGAYSPRELAMMGGVSGISQREIQAQAAFAGMPLYGAANAMYRGGGQWGLNPAAVGTSNQGAFGMVQNAVAAANQGIRQGGIAALGMMPAQMAEVSDQAMREMSPEEAMAQRYSTVTETASRIGLPGSAGFGVTAQALFGRDVGMQMWRTARNPEFWANQRSNILARREAVGADAAALRASQISGLESLGGFFGGRGGALLGRGISDTLSGLGPMPDLFGTDISGAIGGGLSRVGSSAWGAVRGYLDMMSPGDTVTNRLPSGVGFSSAEERSALRKDILAGKDYTSALSGLRGSLDRIDFGRTALMGQALEYGVGGNWFRGMSDAAGLFSVGLAGPIPTLSTGLGAQIFNSQGEQQRILNTAGNQAAGLVGMYNTSQSLLSRGEQTQKDVVGVLMELAGPGSEAAAATAFVNLGGKAVKSWNMSGKKITAEYVEGKLIEELSANLPGFNRKKWDALPESSKSKLRAVFMQSVGRKDKRIADTLRDQVGDGMSMLTGLSNAGAEMLGETIEDRRETLKGEMGWEGMLGIDLKGVSDIEELEKKISPKEMVLYAAAARKGDISESQMQELGELIGSSDIGATALEMAGARKRYGEAGVTSRAAELLGKADFKKLYEYTGLRKAQQEIESNRSALQGLLDTQSAYVDAGAVGDLLARPGVPTAGDVASTYTEEGLQQLARVNPNKARLIQEARRGNADRYQGLLVTEMGLGDEQERSRIPASGKEAEKLRKGAEKMSEMSASFGSFDKAVTTFDSASRRLSAALENNGFFDRKGGND